MIDPRIYRAAFLPALAALVALLFSVEPAPPSLPEGDTPAPFGAGASARTARQIATLAPERTPGSPGDREVADLVEERFAAVEGGSVSRQAFEGEFRDEEVGLENVILTLPGESERQILILAARDSARGPGAASSAAATGTLLELADVLGGSRHRKTLVLASTDGGAAGARGARQLVRGLPDSGLVDAAIVISQPGAAPLREPTVVPFAAGPDSTSSQLAATARRVVAEQTGRASEQPGALAGLARLALPSGLGEQAVLIDEGIDAVGLSSAGERPLGPESDAAEDLSQFSISMVGNAVLALALALDGAGEPPVHGPADYLTLSDNLIPGWSLALMALALILPSLVAVIDAAARAARRGERPLGALLWAVSRAIPLLGALALAYALAVVGLVQRPTFPFDPGRFGIGFGEIVALLSLAAAVVLLALFQRSLRVPTTLSGEALAVGAGLVSSLAVLGIWLLNPYLALLLAPAAHVWVLVSRPGIPVPAIAVAALLSLAPAVAASVYVASALDLGSAAPWHALLWVTSGQLGVLTMGLLALLGGALLAAVAIAAAERPAAPPAVTTGRRFTFAGPGSLGGGPSSPGARESALTRR